MEQKAKEILLEKLEEMAEVTPDTYGAFVNKKLSHLANKKVSQL